VNHRTRERDYLRRVAWGIKGHKDVGRGDPSVSDHDYTDDELEFLRAIDKFIHDKERPHPTWCDALSVLISLGYRKP
jgi:hypothetical protein